MSDFQIVCNAIRDELVGNIPKLFDAKVHMYEPWDPEELSASVGERHLAVWVDPGESERAEPLATGMHMLNQVYVIQVWEAAPGEGDRLKADEAGALGLYDLHNQVRDRLYVEANQSLGGSELVWNRGTSLATRAGSVRFFRMLVRVARVQAFT
jgi:hypothetical protein